MKKVQDYLEEKFGCNDEEKIAVIDELVFCLTDNIANAVNSGGLEAQIEWIAAQCGSLTLKTVREHIEGPDIP